MYGAAFQVVAYSVADAGVFAGEAGFLVDVWFLAVFELAVVGAAHCGWLIERDAVVERRFRGGLGDGNDL